MNQYRNRNGQFCNKQQEDIITLLEHADEVDNDLEDIFLNFNFVEYLYSKNRETLRIIKHIIGWTWFALVIISLLMVTICFSIAENKKDIENLQFDSHRMDNRIQYIVEDLVSEPTE